MWDQCEQRLSACYGCETSVNKGSLPVMEVRPVWTKAVCLLWMWDQCEQRLSACYGCENSVNKGSLPVMDVRPVWTKALCLFWMWDVTGVRPVWTKTLYFRLANDCLVHTVTIISFWTDRPWQTVQTQIRLLLKAQSDQGLHCLPFHLHRLDSLLYGRAT